MSSMGTIHLAVSLLALVLGAVVLRLPKGTRWHRTWGHGYVWGMVGVVATSFALFNLTGSLTLFHGAALVAGVTLVGGMWAALGRRPRKGWIHAHATWMAWSYTGLCAAFVAESMTRFVMPPLAARGVLEGRWGLFWTLVAIGSFGTFAIGALLIRRHLLASVASTPAAMRADRDDRLDRPAPPP